MESTVVVGLIGLLIFVLLLIMGMSIAGSMTLVGFFGFAYLRNFSAAESLLTMDFFSSFNSYNMSVVAMFTLMGYIAYYSGIGEQLFDFAYKLVGHWRGGLAMAAQVACACFGAVCGSNTATAATIGAIALPQMKKYGYNDSLATASVASGGGLGILIPPSMIAIVYGTATQQSIGKLFIAGIAAGILLMLLFMVAISIQIRMNPSLAPRGERASWKERFWAMRGGLAETIIVFIVSVGGLSVGFFTPTEAGSFGAFAILLIVLIRHCEDQCHGPLSGGCCNFVRAVHRPESDSCQSCYLGCLSRLAVMGCPTAGPGYLHSWRLFHRRLAPDPAYGTYLLPCRMRDTGI